MSIIKHQYQVVYAFSAYNRETEKSKDFAVGDKFYGSASSDGTTVTSIEGFSTPSGNVKDLGTIKSVVKLVSIILAVVVVIIVLVLIIRKKRK